MVLSKKTMMMGGISLAAVAALVVLAGVGMNNKTAAVQADQTGLTLTLNSTNGLQSTQTDGDATYAIKTITQDPYFVEWTGAHINYTQSGYFVHIAQNHGEFHNTTTLHEITSVTATGHATESTTGTLLFYTSTDGTTWTSAGADGKITSGTPVSIAASDKIGFIKFEYSSTLSSPENYVESVAITYNCVA